MADGEIEDPAKREGGGVRAAALRALGFTVVVASLGFVAVRGWQLREQLLASWPGPRAAVAVLGGALVYGLAVFLLVVAFRRLLHWCGAPSLSLPLIYQMYARSLIGKYLPGNLFHLAGRHVLGRRLGLSHPALAGAALHEVLGLAAAAGGIALCGMVLGGLQDERLSLPLAAGILLLGLSAPAALGALRRLFPVLGKLGLPESRPAHVAFRALGPALACHAAFFVLVGSVLLVQVKVVSGMPGPGESALVFAAFALAWLAGYVTPGAPAGIGVREAILATLLVGSGVMPEAEGLVAALLLRLSTTTGDVLVFVSARFAPEPA